MTKRVETPQARFKRLERQGKEFAARMAREADISDAEAKRAFEELYASRVRPAKPSAWMAKAKLLAPSGDRRPRG